MTLPPKELTVLDYDESGNEVVGYVRPEFYCGLRMRRTDGTVAELFVLLFESGNWVLVTDDGMKGEFTVEMLRREWTPLYLG